MVVEDARQIVLHANRVRIGLSAAGDERVNNHVLFVVVGVFVVGDGADDVHSRHSLL